MTLLAETGTHWNWIFGGAFALVALWAFVYARAVPQGGARWWALALATAVLTVAGTLAAEGMAATLLIDAAALCAVALIFSDRNPAARRAARIYLVMTLAAIACLLLAERLAGATQPAYPLDRVVSGLLLAGFALKLALAPVYFWLPAVAESAAPVSVVLIISVVDIAAFRELMHFRTAMPWVFDQHQAVWLAVALLSMFLGALLALGQKNLRRMLAFSTIDDMGYLLLGVVAGTEAGLTGALLGALAHALFKLLLFGAVGVAENGLGRPLTLADRGLGCRYPRSAAAFIAGALGMIGVPPMIGFAGRWRIYLAGVELGGVWLGLAMALATVLALFYYVRAVHRVWLGPSQTPAGERCEPKLAGGLLVALIAAVIVLGLIPAWLLAI